MKVKSKLLAVAVAVLALSFAAPAFAAIGNQGKILYTDSVVRDTASVSSLTYGQITRTGNLYVKELSTGIVTQVTSYSGNYVIRNPMFNADGTEILFTSNEGTGRYRVYLVDANTQNTSGKGVLLSDPTDNFTYAALSPDGNTVVFVWQTTEGDALWSYDITTELYQEIYENRLNGLEIRHPVFVDATHVAFVGYNAASGIQDLYLCDLSGPSTVNLTNNTNGNQQYLSLKSGARANAGMFLVYAKRVRSGGTWQPIDIYVATSLVPFLETNVTNTLATGQNEYDACFYGDNAPGRDVPLSASAGNMFYSSRVVGSSVKIWQANFDTTGGPTNTGKIQRSRDSDGNLGQIDWAPPLVTPPTPQDIGNTEITISQTVDTTKQILMVDLDRTGLVEQQTVLTTGSDNKTNPDLGAARIVFASGIYGSGQALQKMYPDGTNLVHFTSGATCEHSPSISADGKWVIYASGNSTAQNLYMKLLSKTETDTGIQLDVVTTYPKQDPVISPDMGSIVWVEKYDGTVTYLTIKSAGLYAYWDGTTNTETATVVGSVNILGGKTDKSEWDDDDPSFSPDGTKIIFVSDRDGTKRIYTMDAATGYNVQVKALTKGGLLYTPDTPAHPVYSPLNDGSIAFVATVSGQRVIEIADANGAVTTPVDALGNPVVVNDDKFSWKFERVAGEITAERTLQTRASTATYLTYRVKIDIDDGAPPLAYTLNEVIIPSTFVVHRVWVDGTEIDTTTKVKIQPDEPSTGLTTVKLLFANTGGDAAGIVADHTVDIELEILSGTTYMALTGSVTYFIAGQAKEASVTGNGNVAILSPFCPVDIYDANKVVNTPDGVIQDLDLLYGIENWAVNSQIPGFGTGWPADVNNWDDIILAVISIWGSPANTQGLYGADAAENSQATASTKAGEYSYVGPKMYKSGTGLPPVPEMYWTQGAWSD